MALVVFLLPITLLIFAGMVKRHGILLYVAGLIVGAGIVYGQRQAVAEACAFNQSECIGAGGFQIIIATGCVLGALIGGALILRRYIQNKAVKH